MLLDTRPGLTVPPRKGVWQLHSSSPPPALAALGFTLVAGVKTGEGQLTLAAWLSSREVSRTERIVLRYAFRASAVAAGVSAALPGPSCLVLDLVGLDPVRTQQEKMFLALEAALGTRSKEARRRSVPPQWGLAGTPGAGARNRFAAQALGNLASTLLGYKLMRSFGRLGGKISPVVGTALAAAYAFQQTRRLGLIWLKQRQADFREQSRDSSSWHR